jgi:hypothetical protein
VAAKKNDADPILEKLDGVLRATQDLFILQALVAGATVDDVRKTLKIDKHRVSNISKHLKSVKQRS